MSDQQNMVMELPAFGKAPETKIDMTKIRYAESRLIDAKTVNPFTYSDLEHTYNEAYRDLKRYLSTVGYLITMAKKAIEDAKADVILGAYQEYVKTNPKDANADVRNAFLTRDAAYTAANERLAQMTALEANLDGKIKVMENVSRYMRKQMDLVLRSGMTSADYYITLGKQNGNQK